MDKELSAQELFEKAEENSKKYEKSQCIAYRHLACNGFRQAYEKQVQEIEKAIDDRISKYEKNDESVELIKDHDSRIDELFNLKQTILSKGVVK
jgi:hypothetical protein